MAKNDTTELLSLLKRRGVIPTGQGLFTDAEILRAVSEEIESEIVPLIVAARSAHMLAHYDQAITSGKSSYRIPTRAVANSLHDVYYIDADGSYSPLDKLEDGEIDSAGIDGGTGTPESFYIEGGNLVLVPTPGATEGTIRYKYFVTPNRLVAVSAIGTISVLTSAVAVTITGAPGTFDGPYDIVQAKSPFEILSFDLVKSTLAAGVLTFTTAYNTDVAVGDYVCLAGETAVPNIPGPLHVIAALRGAATILRPQQPKLADQLEASALMKERKAQVLLSPRVKQKSKAFVNRVWID